MSVLDLGCGEGSVTLLLAEKAKSVTAFDKSGEMLKILGKRAEDKGLNNINCVYGDLKDVSIENIGTYDIIVASRSINAVKNMREILVSLNKIAKKGVYFTLSGPQKDDYVKKSCQILNRDYKNPPSYIYIYNLLYQMGIYANVLNLNCDSSHEYENFDEAFERLEWKIGKIGTKEKELIKDFFNQSLVKKDNGKFINTLEKPDWILIWWKKL
jgi:ubiquinone/menaquinone biosynthesis C-methylase UbiE